MLLVLVQEGCEFEKKLKRPVGDFVKQIVLCYNTDYSTELSSVLQIVVKLLFSFDIGETWDLTTTLKKTEVIFYKTFAEFWVTPMSHLRAISQSGRDAMLHKLMITSSPSASIVKTGWLECCRSLSVLDKGY